MCNITVLMGRRFFGMFLLGFIIIFGLCPQGSAQEESNGSSEGRDRNRGVVLLNYSPLDLLIPSKIGVSAGFIASTKSTYEIEYVRASVGAPWVLEDLGEMTDQRLSLLGRSYFGFESFNLHYGLSYMMFRLNLGSDLLSRISGGATPSIDAIDVHTVGFVFGIGNRWTLNENIMFGIDWLTWTQPIYVSKREEEYLRFATDPSDLNAVQDAVSIVSYFPRLTALKLQVGMSF